jgi:hypothetical protein
MKTIYNKTIQAFCLLLLCLVALPAAGQTPGIEYFMKSSTQKQNFNPALRSRQGFVGFPLLGNTSMAYQTNTLNLDHLVFDTGRSNLVTFLHPDVSADQFLKNITDNNTLSANVNENVLAFGKYIGTNGFMFIDVSGRVNVNASIPRSFFEFAKKGIAQNEASFYDISDVKMGGMAFIDVGGGYSHSLLNDKLVVGGKLKLLLGHLQADVRVNKMMVDAQLDRWTVGADIVVEGYAPFDIRVEKNDEGKFDGVDMDYAFGIAGFGVGLDLGATFNLGGIGEDVSDILNRFTVSLAFTDIGFINWGKGNSTILASSLDDMVVTGDYVIDLENSSSLEDEIDAMTEQLKKITDLKEQAQQGKTTSLHTNMNIGVEYEVMPQLTVGFLSSTRFSGINTISEFTLGGSYRPCDWFEAGLSYSFVYNKFNTIGLALHFAPKKGLNFFLSSDYFLPHVNSYFIPIKAKGMNAMLGVSIPLGRRI